MPNTRLKVLHVIPSLSLEWGGPVNVIAGLTRALGAQGVESTAISASGRRVGLNPIELDGVGSRIIPTGRLSAFWTGYSRKLRGEVEEMVAAADVVHIHELWHYPHYVAAKIACSMNKPYIVRVCGELSPYALSRRRWRKKLYWTLVQKKILNLAGVVQAVTEFEHEQVRKLGIKSSVWTVPHAVDLQLFQNMPEPDRLRGMFPEIGDRKVVLFLSRIDPKKGIDTLLEAFKSIIGSRDDVCLVLAG